MNIRVAVLVLAVLHGAGCAKVVDQPFSGLFNGEITPAVDDQSGGADGGGKSISILSTATVNLAGPSTPGNIAYDGTRLLWMNTLSVSNCFPGDLASFEYLDSGFNAQTTSSSTYVGISSSGSCNGGSFPLFSTAAGKTAMFWKTGPGLLGKISVRDNASGVLESTQNVDVANYGCSELPKLTFCNGLYYGVCKSSGCSGFGCLRFFSFDVSGVMMSAVTTTRSSLSYGNLNALTCSGGDSLILVTGSSDANAYNGFYKYNLSFNLVATDNTTSYQFPSGLRNVVGVATDGTNLFLQGEASQTNPFSVVFGKATLGSLK